MRESGVKQALGEKFFGTGREDLQRLLQERLNIGQQEAGLTRDDFLRGQQMDFDDYLRNLGFAREDEVSEQNLLQGLRGQQLPLEERIKQMALIPFQNNINQRQQNLAGAQQNEQGFMSALAGLVSIPISGYAKNMFPSAQDKFFTQYMNNMKQSGAVPGYSGNYGNVPF